MSLNKTQLIHEVATDTGLTKVESEKAVKSLFNVISKELAAGGSTTLVGFGTFSVVERAARSGKNPKTGAPLQIPAKKVTKFKAGKTLKEMVGKPKEVKKKSAKKK